MPCPFASALGVCASVGGAYTVLVQDRRFRLLTAGSLLLILAAWAGYFLAVRTAPARIALEVLSVAWVVAAALRLRWLMRMHGHRPPLLTPATRLGRLVWSRIGSPWVLGAKVWLLSMLVMEWRGKADFLVLEYTLVAGLLLVLMTLRLRATARPRGFDALESLAADRAAPACPLGFGRGATDDRLAATPTPRGAGTPEAMGSGPVSTR